MKNYIKGLICGLILAALISMYIPASAYSPDVELDYTFAQNSSSAVSHIDTNGDIFVGVRLNRIVYSTDFENWTVINNTPDVSTVIYFDGAFRAIGGGVTLVSTDGINWDQHSNNLPIAPFEDNIAKINGRAIVHAYDYGFGTAGTYSTTNGIEFSKIENFPDGITLYNVNGMLMGESHEYMRGIYYSTDGLNFEKTTIPGYDESYGPFNVLFDGNQYIVNDFWREIDDETYAYQYTSTDLKNWTENIVIRDGRLGNTNYVYIGDELNTFGPNGQNYAINGGVYTSGKYDIYENIGNENIFVYYNCTEFGILAWSNDNRIYCIRNNGDFKSFDLGRWDSEHLVNQNDKFLLYQRNMRGFADRTLENNGTTWIESNEQIDWTLVHSSSNYASNGIDILTTEYVNHGKLDGYPGNPDNTGTITHADGTTDEIVYENTKTNTVNVYGGDGFFLLQPLHFNMWYSPDGITRYDNLQLPFIRSSFSIKNCNFMYLSNFDVICSGTIPNLNDIFPPAPKVMLNGKYLSFEIPPILENDRILIPARFLFEQAGANVRWNEEEQTVTITGDKTIVLKIDSDIATVDGEQKTLDVPAKIINDKTFIPLRFISENLGFLVNWNEEQNRAEIITLEE